MSLVQPTGMVPDILVNRRYVLEVKGKKGKGHYVIRSITSYIPFTQDRIIDEVLFVKMDKDFKDLEITTEAKEEFYIDGYDLSEFIRECLHQRD